MVTVAPAGIMDRAHANFVEAFRALARIVPGARIEERDGVTCLQSGIPYSLFNPAMVLRVPADPESTFAWAREFHDRHRLPWVLRTVPEAAAVMAPIVEVAGMTVSHAMPGMLLNPLAGRQREVPRLRVEIVRELETLHSYFDVMALGFEMPRALMDPFDVQGALDAPDFTYYLGYLDDQPVATALRYTSHRIAGVFNISTVPAHRGRGLGEAMTWQAALGGLDEGCVASYLQASEMGFPVYERMGYRHVVDYPTWDPPETH